jgi:NTE family protein
MEKKEILILGGGSVKGIWECGVLKALSETNYSPDIIIGISVGSLNGAFICNEMGKGKTFKESVETLIDFWFKNIHNSNSIVRKKPFFKLVMDFLFSKSAGFAEFTPMENKVKDIIKKENLLNSNVDIFVGAVNLYSGDIEYSSQLSDDFFDYLIASASIPLIMPPKEIKGVPFLDGGIKQSAGVIFALEKIIKNNINDYSITLITPHPQNLKIKRFKNNNILALGDRIMDIISVDNINDDIKILQMSGVEHKIVRPEDDLNISLNDFNINDIKTLFELGYFTGKNKL